MPSISSMICLSIFLRIFVLFEVIFSYSRVLSGFSDMVNIPDF